METTLAGLARELEAAAASVTARGAKAVATSALAVKDQARRNAQQSSGIHAAQYPRTIGYDLVGDGLGAEIGPARHGQGNLGPILENGSVNNPPHRDLGRALDDEEPLFLEAAAKLAMPWR